MKHDYEALLDRALAVQQQTYLDGTGSIEERRLLAESRQAAAAVLRDAFEAQLAEVREQPPSISDEWIIARWPDEDVPKIRRRWDALMNKIGETPWRGIPRYPEVMVPVLAWAAMLPKDRIEHLVNALAQMPEHFRNYLFVAEKPAFGEQRVKTESVCGDDGHGMGRQAVAITPYIKGYNIAPWIAAASPGNVGALLGEMSAQVTTIAERDATIARLEADAGGWIVGNANADRWRTWNALSFSDWTKDRDKATRYARREDAEAVHAQDEDAWRIEPYARTAIEGANNGRD